MLDLVEVIKQVGYSLDIGYWMIEVEKRVAYWPKGLGQPRDEAGERSYHASSVERLLNAVAVADQGRFRGFLADILQSGADRTIEIVYLASWGGRVHLRLVGRRVGQGKDARIVGLVEVIDRLKDAERLAKSLGFIIEALFISSDSGIVIFDGQLRIRRLNRHAIELFGITEDQELEVDWAETIEARLPKSTRDSLLEAIENSTAVSGMLSVGGLGGPHLTWRANPWGAGEGDLSGLVMIVDAKRGQARTAFVAERELFEGKPAPRPAAAPPPASPSPPVAVELPPLPRAGVETDPSRRHLALEWVKHPIVLISISTGEIVFANRAARDLFMLPPGVRCFVENVFDLSGFACDVDSPVVAAAGGRPLRLRLGARVGRMVDYDSDLLFVEYHEVVPRFRAPALQRVVVSHGSTNTPPVVARPGAR